MRHFVTLIVLLLALAGATRGWVATGHSGLASVQGHAGPHILWTETAASADLSRAIQVTPEPSDGAAPWASVLALAPTVPTAFVRRALSPVRSPALSSPTARAPPFLA